MKLVSILLVAVYVFAAEVAAAGKYEPNWESLDARPLPSWFDEAKIGIFLHWGVFSVPSTTGEWFWSQWAGNDSSVVEYMSKYYPKNFLYPDFAKYFTAEFFDPEEWADIIAKSGAKYVVLTGKHHEGYAMWPSKYSYNWNAKDVGPGRDLLGELSVAIRDKNLKFGIYHSLFEWFHPLYQNDRSNNFLTRDFVTQKVLPEMIELIETYKPSILWSDGDWEAPETYWGSTDFLAWLYNESPIKDVVVTNDRWGSGTACHHGGFLSCKDWYNPGVLQTRKFEDAITIDTRSWGYRRNARLEDYLTTLDLITQLASAVSCGGNLLINIGPTKDGIIAPIFQDRLKSFGEWLQINGEAIYGTKPWSAQNDTSTWGVWYTAKDEAVYAIVLYWPYGNVLEVTSANTLLKDENMQVSMLGTKGTLKWVSSTNKAKIFFPDKSTVVNKDAYVLKFQKGSSTSES